MPAPLFRRILVPHDFSPQATVALKAAARLAREHDGSLTVLHVVVPFYVPADVPFGFAADAMPSPTMFVPEQRKRLTSLVDKALGKDAPRVTYRVDVGDASQCILDAARRTDSIVMSTSGRSGLSHLLIGSVAEKVVRHATVPVLTIRVPDKKQVSRARTKS
ncbi:MAG TPA: universal stress protein [Candidatus Binatia bacterium]|nr:universal stress protein [Candidatus Binatia bacterium]